MGPAQGCARPLYLVARGAQTVAAVGDFRDATAARASAIILSGAPATGKTTMRKRITGEFALSIFSRDGVKDDLCDSLGADDRS